MSTLTKAITLTLLAGCLAGAHGTGAEPPRGLQPHLLAISVGSLHDAIAWYEDIAGLRLVERKAYPDQHLELAFLESRGGFRLELVQLEGSISPGRCADVSNPATLRGPGKFAFQVDDLREIVSALDKRGAAIFRDFRGSSPPNIIVKDADGNWIQFFQRRR